MRILSGDRAEDNRKPWEKEKTAILPGAIFMNEKVEEARSNSSLIKSSMGKGVRGKD